jgi:hypothetical protein
MQVSFRFVHDQVVKAFGRCGSPSLFFQLSLALGRVHALKAQANLSAHEPLAPAGCASGTALRLQPKLQDKRFKRWLKSQKQLRNELDIFEPPSSWSSCLRACS